MNDTRETRDWRKGTARIVIAAVLWAVLVGLLDYRQNHHARFHILYLIPVGLATLRAGRFWGVAVTLVTFAAWATANHLTRPASADVFTEAWEMVVALVFLLTIHLTLYALKTSLAREETLARTDPVVRTANTRAFNERAEMELERSKQNRMPLTMVYMDLDNFKTVNDKYGHAMGDEVLREVATTAQENLRASDYIARLGGDEFAVLLPDTDEAAAIEVLSRLHSKINEKMTEKGWPLTTSVGAATFTKPPPDVREMIRQADKLMYRAKGEGKNSVQHAVESPSNDDSGKDEEEERAAS